MELDIALLPEIFLYSFGLGFLYWLLYRRYIFSVADPIFIFIVNTAFGSVLVIEVLSDSTNIVHYFVCQFCLWLGFAIVQEYYKNPAIKGNINSQFSFTDYSLLQTAVYVLWVIYLLTNLFLFYTKGFALFSDVPSEAKVGNFREGFGLVRKINGAVGGVSATGLTFLWLEKRHRRDILLLVVVIGLSALDGSKGALLKFVFCFSLFIYHPFFRRYSKLIGQMKRLLPVAFFSVLIIFFTVLLRERGNTETAVLGFFTRLLSSSDSVLYFYIPVNQDYFASYHAFDFPARIINPILGFLRLAPYQEAPGNIMVENLMTSNSVKDVIVGPNTSFYIEGQIYFGYYGAFLYSFILGVLQGWFRSTYFLLIRSSAFFFVCFNLFYIYSTYLWTESTLFISSSFDVVILVLPIYLIISFIIKNKFSFKRIGFSSS